MKPLILNCFAVDLNYMKISIFNILFMLYFFYLYFYFVLLFYFVLFCYFRVLYKVLGRLAEAEKSLESYISLKKVCSLSTSTHGIT